MNEPGPPAPVAVVLPDPSDAAAPIPPRRRFFPGCCIAAFAYPLRHPGRAATVAGLLLLIGVASWMIGVQAWASSHFQAAQIAVERYHHREAREHLLPYLKVWPRDPAALLLAARTARRSGAFEDAERRLDQYESVRGKDDENNILERVLLQAQRGRLDRVRVYCENRLRQNHPDAPLVLEAETSGLIRTYRLGEAEDRLGAWLKLRPDDCQALLYQGMLFDLQETIRKNPGRAGPARVALAEGYMRMYRVLDTLALLDRWQQEQPDEVEATALRGDLYWQIGALGKAADEYRRVVELDPQRREARERLGAGLLESGRYEEALKQLEQVRQGKPDDPAVLVRLARCHERLNRARQAREILDGVLARRPDNGPALRLRGQMLLQAGQAAEAEDWLRRAVLAMPDDYQASWSLYQCLEKQEKTDEAKAQRTRAEDLKDGDERLAEITTREMNSRPRDPALHCELGKLLLKKGMKSLGARWFLSALHLDPHYQPAHDALAEYYREQGDEDKAAEHLREARTSPAVSPPPKGP